MYFPSLQLVSDTEMSVFGDVIIHPTAVIAPGAILQAASGSRIIIGAGVCIGMGAILKTYAGTLEVEDGVILGAGVLIVGQGKIGSNACIGTATTIFEASVDRSAVIPAASLIGDASRQATASLEEEQKALKAELINEEAELSETKPEAEVADENDRDGMNQASISTQQNTSVVGRMYVKNLLLTLFPHRLNNPTDNNH